MGALNMKRRSFLSMLFLGPLLGVALPKIGKAAPRCRILIQHSAVAGFQYHQGDEIWPWLATGQSLLLIREPHNAYDEFAVAIYWHSYKLGYIPRRENIVIAQMIDRGETPLAIISHLAESHDPWQRTGIKVEVLV